SALVPEPLNSPRPIRPVNPIVPAGGHVKIVPPCGVNCLRELFATSELPQLLIRKPPIQARVFLETAVRALIHYCSPLLVADSLSYAVVCVVPGLDSGPPRRGQGIGK